MTSFKFTLLSLVMVLVVACHNYNESKNEIESKISSFYSKQESIYNISINNGLFSKALSQEIENLRGITNKDANRIKNSSSPFDKPIIFEGSIFTSIYDGYQKHTIKEVIIKEKTAEVTVDFEYNSAPKIFWTDKVFLINDDGWKIDNIQFDSKISKDKNLRDRITSLVITAGTIIKDIDNNQVKMVRQKTNAINTSDIAHKGKTAPLK
jgi:hypothetical protein